MAWFYCPTQTYLEPNALKNNAAVLKGVGKRCLVVTGRTSATASGVMDDLAEILPSLGVEYKVFNEIDPNPTIHTCHSGGQYARGYGADFVIGAGGGSALDAAKAIAAYAANDVAPMGIYETLPNLPLPMAAIPTTAGTGSEVNGFAILTIPELGVKRTYSSLSAFPFAAFLDPRYTASLPYDQTISTALDVFCHCAESYFSPRSTVLTRALGVKGADLSWRGLLAVEADKSDEATRSDLLGAAMLGGICIAHAGTGYPHPAGYNLTLSYGIPHGAACAIFEDGYLRRQAAASAALYDEFLRLANLPGDAPDKLRALAGPVPHLTADEIKNYANLIAGVKNFSNSIAPVGSDAASIAMLYEELFS
jgi:alcohol dehydrogenase class IV